jgi:hypothetical protein
VKLDDAVASLPARSPFRKILQGLFDENEETRDAARNAINEQGSRKIGKHEAIAVLKQRSGSRFRRRSTTGSSRATS